MIAGRVTGFAALCSTAKFCPDGPLWVIFDRPSRWCLPVYVRFSPKASEMLHHCRADIAKTIESAGGKLESV
jgi:hypothetical protein